MKKISLLVVALMALPLVSFAQDFSNIESMINSIGNIINTLVPIAFTLGLLVFFWGVVTYIFGADHDKDKAKKTMLWGIVALFVMASVWGLVAFLRNTFGIAEIDDANVPGVTP